MAARTQHARSGDSNIAYRVVGEGPFDQFWIPGFVSNVEPARRADPKGAGALQLDEVVET